MRFHIKSGGWWFHYLQIQTSHRHSICKVEQSGVSYLQSSVLDTVEDKSESLSAICLKLLERRCGGAHRCTVYTGRSGRASGRQGPSGWGRGSPGPTWAGGHDHCVGRGLSVWIKALQFPGGQTSRWPTERRRETRTGVGRRRGDGVDEEEIELTGLGITSNYQWPPSSPL